VIAGIASFVFIPLLAVFFAHLIWAFGAKWPMQDRDMLARTVIGLDGAPRMPPRLVTLVFALLTLYAGVVALALSDPTPSATDIAVGSALAVLLLVRGGAGYTAQWRKWRPAQPFAAMDRKYYSPLALYLGAGFAFLVIWRFV